MTQRRRHLILLTSTIHERNASQVQWWNCTRKVSCAYIGNLNSYLSENSTSRLQRPVGYSKNHARAMATSVAPVFCSCTERSVLGSSRNLRCRCQETAVAGEADRPRAQTIRVAASCPQRSVGTSSCCRKQNTRRRDQLVHKINAEERCDRNARGFLSRHTRCRSRAAVAQSL
jgi:hypothetical protein